MGTHAGGTLIRAVAKHVSPMLTFLRRDSLEDDFTHVKARGEAHARAGRGHDTATFGACGTNVECIQACLTGFDLGIRGPIPRKSYRST